MRKAAPSFLDSPVNERRERVKRSQQQETRIARMGGGRRVRGSGAKAHARGDARWDKYGGLLIEAKRTDKGSISIKGEVLDKITREAMANGKFPAVAIEVATDFAARDWILLPVDFVLKLLDAGEKAVDGWR